MDGVRSKISPRQNASRQINAARAQGIAQMPAAMRFDHLSMRHNHAVEIPAKHAGHRTPERLSVANHEPKECTDPDQPRQTHDMPDEKSRPAASLRWEMEQQIGQQQGA